MKRSGYVDINHLPLLFESLAENSNPMRLESQVVALACALHHNTRLAAADSSRLLLYIHQNKIYKVYRVSGSLPLNITLKTRHCTSLGASHSTLSNLS
jgi:hypothetical protein